MIIWSGWGFLVVIIGGVSLVVTQLTVNAAMHDNLYYTNNSWPKFLALVIAAVITWPVGRAINRQRPVRRSFDDQSGQWVVQYGGGGHTLFFIPMEYWAPILVVIGVIFAFTR